MTLRPHLRFEVHLRVDAHGTKSSTSPLRRVLLACRALSSKELQSPRTGFRHRGAAVVVCLALAENYSPVTARSWPITLEDPNVRDLGTCHDMYQARKPLLGLLPCLLPF